MTVLVTVLGFAAGFALGWWLGARRASTWIRDRVLGQRTTPAREPDHDRTLRLVTLSTRGWRA